MLAQTESVEWKELSICTARKHVYILMNIALSRILRSCRQVLRAVGTKSKDEIEHERAREPLVEAVGDAWVRKQIHDHRLGTLLQTRDTYMKDKK